jgi:signal transduction histidine kinase/Na+/proline symporter
MSLLVAITGVYLAFLFLLAWIGKRRARAGLGGTTGITLSLALGVMVTSASYYGHTGFAVRHGSSVLGFHIGATLVCMLGPVLWEPILRVCRSERLHSLADLFAFRFRSQALGALTTAIAVIASIPYFAQQLRAITESAAVLDRACSPGLLALVSSLLLAAFTVLFGGPPSEPGAAGVVRTTEQTAGVVFAVAFESVVKLIALAAAAIVALFVVFEGPGALFRWASTSPSPALPGISTDDIPWSLTFVVIGLASPLVMPRQFHIAFASAPTDRAFRRALAGLPLYLLVLYLCTVCIAYGARRLGVTGPDDFAAMSMPQALGLEGVTWLVYLGGVSASSAMVIVTTVALVRMVVVHFALPVGERFVARDLYRRLAWLHRAIAVALVFAGSGFFFLLQPSTPFLDLSTVALLAFVQFLPGVVATVFFARATRAGMLAGLSTGVVVWALTALAPLLGLLDSVTVSAALDGATLAPQALSRDPWTFSLALSLGANTVVFGVVSLATRATRAELEAALRFTRAPRRRGDGATSLTSSVPPAASTQLLEERLTPRLGRDAAQTEVRRSVVELSLGEDGTDAPESERLARRLEANLSELLGPVLAQRIVEDAIDGGRGTGGAPPTLAEQLQSIDDALDRLGPSLSGPAAELDVYRRFLRAVLDGLPLGICAIGPDLGIVLWNAAIAGITGIPAREMIGRRADELPQPIAAALRAAADGMITPRQELAVGGGAGERRLLLHLSRLDPGLARAWSGCIVAVVDDVTERRALEAELAHRDRLATIGRVAAGVAHEIGSPLTGITLLTTHLRRERPDERERFDMILDYAGRIDTIVRELLSYSRADASMPPLVRPQEEIAVPSLVDEAFDLVRFDHGRASTKAVELQNVSAPDAVVLGDPKRLTQVMVNLVANAIDAAPDRGGHVVVGASREPDRVVVTVADDGPGIAATVLPHLFEPFFSTKEPGRGTGLGLWLVHTIVREHGGDISVASEPGKGTTIRFWLPRPDLTPAV